jgi:hypothetical protein
MNQTTEDALSITLEKSIELHQSAHGLIDAFEPYPDLRYELAFHSGLLSMEHATAAMLLMQNDLPAPAITLLRPQYESLVRGIWLMFAATENQVEKLAMPLTEETAKRGDDLPMLSDMLKQLEKAEQTPKHLVVQLKSYKDIAWKALNSYAHGGMHPLSRYVMGYPPKLVRDSLCNSNGIMMMAAQLLCIVTGNPDNQAQWRRLVDQYAECFHPFNEPAAQSQ